MDLILLLMYYHPLAHILQAVKLEMPAGTPSTLLNTIPGEGLAMAVDLDFRVLVERVVRRCEELQRIPVSTGAINILVEAALPYRDRVEQELLAGQISIAFLEYCVFTVLENAREIAANQRRDPIEIDEHIMQESMRRYCPYIFWC